MNNFAKSQALQKRAQTVVPLGVNSNFRYWGDGSDALHVEGKGRISVGCGRQQIY